MEFLAPVIAGLVGLTCGALFAQRIKDWFAGVESDLRAKANDAGGAVLAAAYGERDRVQNAMRDAADRAVAGAKAAVVGEVAKVIPAVAEVVTPVAPMAAPPAA